MEDDVSKLEQLYQKGKWLAEQFELLFDDVVPSRAYEDRVRLVGREERTEVIPPAPERPHTAKALKMVEVRTEEWAKLVNDVLGRIGGYNLLFNDPQTNCFKTNKPDLTKNEKELCEAVNDMASRVIALKKIIVDIERNTAHSKTTTRKQPKQPHGKVIYQLEYDTYKTKLTLNGVLILNPHLDGTSDKAFQKAFKSPNTPVKIIGSMSSTIGNLKIPSALKDIMFNCSKGAFQVNPAITEDDLSKYGINKLTIDQELQKLTQ